MSDHEIPEEEYPTVEGELLDSIPGAYDPDDDTEILDEETQRALAERVLRPPDEDEDLVEDPGRVRELMQETVRQKRGSRLAIFPLAMGFIALGSLLLAEGRVEGLEVSPGAATVILIGALVLTYMFRFFISGRRERGLFFLAVVIICWGGVVALSSIDNETFPLEEFWPLTLAGVGVALFLTFLFERSHQAGLIFPGIILLFASGIAFLITLDIVEQPVLDTVADYWPLVISFIGLTLLPAALQGTHDARRR